MCIIYQLVYIFIYLFKDKPVRRRWTKKTNEGEGDLIFKLNSYY